MKNKLLKTPNPLLITQNEKCGASWQLLTNGAIGKLKCRVCGVYVTDGGTPKCLKNK